MSVTAVPLQPTRRANLVLLWLGIVIAIAAAIWLAFHGTSAARAQVGSNEQFLAWNAKQPGVKTTADGLEYKMLKAGDGDKHPTDDDISLINYSGALRDGTVFDQSKQPTPLPVAGSIKGFSEGLKLMTKGAKYRFWIKPELGYGEQGAGPIPPDSLLVFDVELVDFLPQSVVQQQMRMQQMMQGGGAPDGAGPPGQ
ncbi:FKBP-type peptidyl-prolyl cis-trans isomerase [Hephaestia mangrovi]|uniref:FKBP-type peptidyl-prolyl cis-trans isomerase n=1 Tax=Hephaestia mangrovi TaxID=2873268 RepID=UPI001CA707E8|nr:FKBP-type peptidyl-prolyl cis-trans isomerase [Hephaestia mangrovi]MBY8827741.1 FKBP-type peptidyl-prolyl cis-trans isomerase [Hephaestia mangrovi]